MAEQPFRRLQRLFSVISAGLLAALLVYLLGIRDIHAWFNLPSPAMINDPWSGAGVRMAGILLLGMWLLVPRTASLPLRRVAAPLVIFLVFGLLAALWSVDRHTGLLEWGMWAGYAGLFVATVWSTAEAPVIPTVAAVLEALGAGVALYNLFRYRMHPAAYDVPDAFFAQADAMVGWLLLIWPISLAGALGAPGRRALCSALVAVVMGADIVLCTSRGGWIAMGIVSVVLAAALWRRMGLRVVLWRSAILAVALWAAVGLFAADTGPGLVPGRVAQRAQEILSGRDSSVSARLVFWKAAVRMAWDHRLTGVGPGSYDLYYPQYQSDPRYYARYPHNMYLSEAAEVGPLGALALVVAVTMLVTIPWRRPVSGAASPRKDWLVWGLAGGVAASCLHAVVDVDWNFPAVGALFWVVAGLLVAQASDSAPPAQVPAVPFQWSLLRITGIGVAIVLLVTLPVQARVVRGILLARLADTPSWMEAAPQDLVMQSNVLLEEAAVLDPYNSVIHEQLARNALLRWRLRPAPELIDVIVREATRAVDLNPGSISARLQLGDIYWTVLRQPEVAVKQYIAARGWDPINKPVIYAHLANYALAHHQVGEAQWLASIPIGLFPVSSFKDMFPFRIRQLRSELAGCRQVLVYIALDQGQWPLRQRWTTAFDHALAGLALDPLNLELWAETTRLSIALKGGSRAALIALQAMPAIQEALRPPHIDPVNGLPARQITPAQGALLQGIAAYLAGQPNAGAALKRAVQANPGSGLAHYLWGRSLVSAGRIAQGRTEMAKGAGLEPGLRGLPAPARDAGSRH